MKKLLITAIATAGMAFGLRAADAGYLAGTDFEDGAVPSTGWTIPQDDPGQTLVNTANTDVYSGNVPTQWTDSNHNKFLAVKTTFGKPISLDLATAQAMSDGAYFDSLVKMTVCDEAPAATTYAGAKIMVWAQENADGTATSLWVRASAPDGSGWKSQDFQCTGSFGSADAWHRLTIKAIPDIFKAASARDYVPGFVVYVDGNPIKSGDAVLEVTGLNDNAATFNETGKLFVSLDQTSNDKTTISAVAFDGQGSLDDVTLTSAAPDFAKDYEFFTIDLGTNVTGFNYAITSGDSGSATSSLQLPYTANMVVTISNVTCADGKMFKDLTADTGVTVAGNTFTVTLPNLHGVVNAQDVGVTIGDQKFANLADAITYINGTDASGALAVSFASGYTPDAFATGIKPGANVTSLTIDLAGKTLTYTGEGNAIEAAVPLFVTNSTETVGTIVAEGTEAKAIYQTAGKATIYDGIFNGAVGVGRNGSAELFGGQYLAAKNQKEGEEEGQMVFSLKDSVAPGYTHTPEPINGYYVVSVYAPKGDGESAETAFEIDSIQALNWVKDQVAAGNTFAGKFLKQTANIDFNGAVFEGIGEVKKDNISGDNSFQGTYNGQGLTISNFKFPADKTYRGFFNTLVGSAVVKNLTFETLGFDTATVNEWGAGIAAGSIQGPVTLQNITTKGAITGCHNTAGIAAKATTKDGTPSFIACTNEAAIVNNYTQNPKAGGIIALCEGATFVDCYNKGAITVTHKKVTNTDYGGAVGGLVAWMQSSNSSITGGGNEGTISVGNSEAVDGTAGVTCGSLIGSVADKTTTIAAGVKTLSNQLAVGGMGSPKTPDGGTLVGGMFVADGVTVTPVKNGSYKVVAPRAVVPAIELGAGDTLTIDTTLATAVDTAVTAASGLDLVTDKTTAVWTYSTKATEIPVSSITIDQGETAEVEIGKTITLTATVKPDDATDPTVTWTSDDTSKATVVDGVVTGVAAGDVVITATAGDQTDTITITVKAAAPAYPSYIPTSDDALKAKWDTWAAGKSFDDAEAKIVEEAFLLNCALDKVDEAKAAFKCTAITVDGEGNVTVDVADGDYNGYVAIQGKVELTDAEWHAKDEGDKFFQAILTTVKPVED